MLDEHALDERIRAVLRPYAANWSGSLGQGDLVIPSADLGGVVGAIVEAVREFAGGAPLASELEVFEALADLRRMPSIQDQAAGLIRRFRIGRRTP